MQTDPKLCGEKSREGGELAQAQITERNRGKCKIGEGRRIVDAASRNGPDGIFALRGLSGRPIRRLIAPFRTLKA